MSDMGGSIDTRVFLPAFSSIFALALGCASELPPDGAQRQEPFAPTPTALAFLEQLHTERARADADPRFWPESTADGVTLSHPDAPDAPVARLGTDDVTHLDFGAVEARFQVVSIGRPGARMVIESERPEASGAEAQRRLGAGVREWWRSLPSGIEHGLTLERRPAGQGALAIDVAIAGLALHALSGDAVALVREEDGAREWVASYSHLLVTDADGELLPSRMRVRDDRVRIEIDDDDARYPLVVDPLLATFEATLLDPSGAMYDMLGESVALSGDGSRAIVAGAAPPRVFLRTGSVWTHEATLPAPFHAAFTAPVGRFVALSDDGSRAIVGVPGDDTGATDAGSAVVFVRSGTSWSEEATLRAPTPTAGGKLGFSVALSALGDRALVCAPGSGVSFFVRSGAIWSEEASAPTPSCHAVALSAAGDRALAGLRGNVAGVYVRSGATWSPEATLTDPTSTDIDPSGFGVSVALSADGSRAIVGAATHLLTAPDAGGQDARVFVRSGSAWSLEARLVYTGARADPYFGWSVALSADGSRALVGAPLDNTIVGWGGSARLFERSGTSWSERFTMREPGASRADRYDYFGFSVALAADGSRALVGNPRDDTTSATRAGTGRVFVLEDVIPAVNGSPCSVAAECTSGFCIDDVCCESLCNGGAPNDCRACSVAQGGTADGACTTLTAAVAPTVMCRTAFGPCDAPEHCTASSTECPVDAVLDASTVCRPSTGPCDLEDACTGSSPSCPADELAPAGTSCADGIACNGEEACGSAGECLDGAAPCDDGDPCTADMCAEPGDCTHEPVTGCAGPDAGGADGGVSAADGGAMGAPDGGAMGAPDGGAMGTPDAGPGTADAGADALTPDDGCGCAAVGSEHPPSGVRIAALLALWLLLLSRRRRRLIRQSLFRHVRRRATRPSAACAQGRRSS